MTPIHPEPEETQTPQRAAALELWLVVEMWFASWLARWQPHRAQPQQMGGHWAHAEAVEAVRVESPCLFYLAHAPRMDVTARRFLARRVCLCLAVMRVRGRGIAGFIESVGSRRVVYRRWRRLFRVFVDFARSVRGDGVLPRARVRLPEGGYGPPGVGSERRRARPREAPGRARGHSIYST